MHEMTKDLASENITFEREKHRSIYIYSIFKDTISSSGYITPNDRFINELEGIGKEDVVAEFELSLQPTSCWFIK
jgi:hypothetical protein